MRRRAWTLDERYRDLDAICVGVAPGVATVAGGSASAGIGVARVRNLRSAVESFSLGVHRALVLSIEAAIAVRSHVLVPGVSATRQRAVLASDQRMDRDPHGRREPRGRGTGGIRARAAPATVAKRYPAGVPASASDSESPCVREHRASLLPDR